MNRFSASEAALEGFRLTRERPGAILAWSGIYAGGMLLIGEVMLSSLGADALAIARKGQFSPEDAQVFATKLVHSIPAFMLVLLLAVVLISVITGGIYRLVLRPEQPGFLHLRLGGDEVRLTLVNLLLFAIGLLCLLVGFVAIAAAEQTGSAIGFAVAPLGWPYSPSGLGCDCRWRRPWRSKSATSPSWRPGNSPEDGSGRCSA